MSKEFWEDYDEFHKQYHRCNRNISKRCKTIERATKTMAYEMFGLSTEIEHLQKIVSEKTEIPQYSMMM